MKTTFITILKAIFIVIAVFIIFVFAYGVFVYFDTQKVNAFCEEMKPGLEVTQIHTIAQKHDVGFESIRDPNSVKNHKLGIKLKDQKDSWFFAVAAPSTMGEHSCGVYHDNKVIISASIGW